MNDKNTVLFVAYCSYCYIFALLYNLKKEIYIDELITVNFDPVRYICIISAYIMNITQLLLKYHFFIKLTWKRNFVSYNYFAIDLIYYINCFDKF